MGFVAGNPPEQAPNGLAAMHKGGKALFDYWSSLRKGAALPAAEEFDLLALTPWLSDIMIMDVRSETDIPLRFTGTAVIERIGYEMTGRNALLLQPENMRPFAAKCFQFLVNMPCAAISRYATSYSSGRESIVRSLYLPLDAPPGGTRRVVCLHVQEKFLGYRGPTGQTLAATEILRLDWLDIGFGVPEIPRTG